LAAQVPESATLTEGWLPSLLVTTSVPLELPAAVGA
jgi:hypothetical protein